MLALKLNMTEAKHSTGYVFVGILHSDRPDNALPWSPGCRICGECVYITVKSLIVIKKK